MKKLIYLITFLFITHFLFGQNSVLTHRYSNLRTGWTINEQILSTSNVNQDQFGFLFSRAVDDQCYATPLIVSNLTINGKTQNVLYIATMNNSLYAFDADDSANMTPLFHVNVRTKGNRDLESKVDVPCTNYGPNIGIISTPVIDTISKTIYLVSNEYDTTLKQAQQYFHALDITTGMEKQGSPTLIQTYVIGNGAGSKNDTLYFNANTNDQRASLLLFNGVVYVSWAGFCDDPPYHGWFMGFDATTYKLKYTYNDTPNGSDGGIWLGGNGPSVDSTGNIYLISGNGTVNKSNPDDPTERGQSIIKVRPNGDSLQVVDFFTPNNYAYIDTNDLDYGSGTAVLIPHSNLSLSIGKQGLMYLVDDTRLGKYSSSNDSVIQTIWVTPVYKFPQWNVFGSPVYYNYVSGNDSEFIYEWASFDTLKQYYFDRNTMTIDLNKTIKGTKTLPEDNYGPVLSGSSNGTLVGTGIVWVLRFITNEYNGNALLEAYDARNVSRLLWSSNTAGNNLGLYTKFIYPVVANGKVYICTNSNAVYVYGLKKINTSGVRMAYDINLNLYPNPANDMVTLQYSLPEPNQYLTVSFYDIYGRLVFTSPLNTNSGVNTTSFSIKEVLHTGIYSVIVSSRENIYKTVKLVIN